MLLNIYYLEKIGRRELIMAIPCKTCIALAACVAKEQIECEIIYEILRQEVKFNGETDRLGSISLELRKQLLKLFPNARSITKMTNQTPRLIFKGFN
jgi:hypothetical protein